MNIGDIVYHATTESVKLVIVSEPSGNWAKCRYLNVVSGNFVFEEFRLSELIKVNLTEART